MVCKVLYDVYGNHPVLRYVTKFKQNYIEMRELVEELRFNGYEIEVKIHKEKK